ncbi:MAG TPA: thiamine pyrophosphate-binding protein [Phycisphaerae bacterium]|nr:thiamine pyrophosphate-binding protein [Phycisphaerae bacterium]
MPHLRDGRQHTVGSFLFDYLYSKGVRHAFGIPGDFALPTFRRLEESKIQLITMTHEPMVGFAADGYARTHGLGLACVTYCVGGAEHAEFGSLCVRRKEPRDRGGRRAFRS